MIYRKIMERLEKFYHEAGRTALLIDGARQVGKTFIDERSAGRSHCCYWPVSRTITPRRVMRLAGWPYYAKNRGASVNALYHGTH